MAGDASYNNVVLLLHGDGVINSVSFVDNSSSRKTPAVFGNAKISTAQSKFGGASMLFDGAGDYLSYADSTDFEFGSGAFTVEAWVRLTGYASDNGGFYRAMICAKDVSGAREFDLSIDGTASSYTTLTFTGFVGGTPTSVSPSYSFALDTWYHVAAVRSGSLVYLFVDGALLNPGGTAFGITISATSAPLKVGAQEYDGTFKHYFPGYLDDLRITKGVARYTANFTPPTVAFGDGVGHVTGQVRDDTDAPCARVVRAYRRASGALIKEAYSSAGDANYNEVTLLLRGDGANGSTTITDLSRSPKTATVYGALQLSTSQAKFGPSSIYFDGSTSRFTIPQSSDFSFSTDNFTIEFWVHPTATRAGNCCILNTQSALNNTGWHFDWYSYFVLGNQNNAVQVASSTVSLNTWTHVAFVRASGVVTPYLNGVAGTPATVSGALNVSSLLEVGKAAWLTQYFPGYLDDLRITKGVARYTANFTPPADCHPDKRAGDLGDFELWLPTSDEHNIVYLDDDAGTLHNDLIHRVIPG